MQLGQNICSTIELVLLLISKVFAIDDKEISSLMDKEWNLKNFAHELFIALASGIKFGGYTNDFKKEIKVRV